MNRNELKTMFLQQDFSNVKEKKQIIVKPNTNYGKVEILSEGPNGFSSFKTCQKFPFEYIKTRKKYTSGEYELIVK